MLPRPSTKRVCLQRRTNLGLAIRCRQSAAVLVFAFSILVGAEPIAARHPEGTLHGFLALTTDQGQVLADGDVVEIVRGDRVTSHVTFHFKDGSLDEETTVYTQRGVFRLDFRSPYSARPFLSSSARYDNRRRQGSRGDAFSRQGWQGRSCKRPHQDADGSLQRSGHGSDQERLSGCRRNQGLR